MKNKLRGQNTFKRPTPSPNVDCAPQFGPNGRPEST